MGMFSWYTQDTHERIINGVPFKVCLSDNKGNKYWEECYEGYGVFGGKDYYVLMAEMNGYSIEYKHNAYYIFHNGKQVYDKLKQKAHFIHKHKAEDWLRQIGIDMAFDGNPYGTSDKWLHPSITTNGTYYNGVSPEPDPNQGFFDDDDYDEESFYFE